MTCIASTIAALRKAGYVIEFPPPPVRVKLPPPRPVQKVRQQLQCDPKPETWEGYCEAARKAVKLYLTGESKARSALRCGLSECFQTGITHVLEKTPLFRRIAAGKKPEPDTPRHLVSFIRWHEGILPPSKVHGDDTERLRERLKRVDYVLVDLEARSGVHHTSIMKFRNGSVKGMRPGTRAKLWEALGGDK